MAGTHLTVSVNANVTLEHLQRLQNQLSAPQGMLSNIGERLKDSTRDRFERNNQRGPDGTPWRALSPRYARTKRKNKDRILVRDGYLANTIAYQLDGADAVIIGSNRKYAAIQQFGGTIQKKARSATVYFGAGKIKNLFVKKKNAARRKQVAIGSHQITIPARPFLGLSETDRQEIVQITLAWLRQ